jgi:hypothetical protein
MVEGKESLSGRVLVSTLQRCLGKELHAHDLLSSSTIIYTLRFSDYSLQHSQVSACLVAFLGAYLGTQIEHI